MKNPIQIQLISAEQTYSLRHKILRPHEPFEAVKYADDFSAGAFHVGAFFAEKIVGIATFASEHHAAVEKLYSGKNSYRLRGMATDFDFHGQGIGAAVLHFSFAVLRQKQCDLLWCNAREIAFPFYEKLGFRFVGELFDIGVIGPHKVMYKPL